MPLITQDGERSVSAMHFVTNLSSLFLVQLKRMNRRAKAFGFHLLDKFFIVFLLWKNSA